MKKFIFLYFLYAIAFANAHIVLNAPRGRSVDSNLRNGPCGDTNVGPLRLSVLVGTLFTVRFTEMLPHGGNFNVNLLDSNGNLIEFLGSTPSVPPFVGDYNVPVTPTTGCKNCILQVEFVTDEPDQRIYYQCSDVTLLLPGEGEELAQAQDDGVTVIPAPQDTTAFYFSIGAVVGVLILGIAFTVFYSKMTKAIQKERQTKLITKKYSRHRV